MIITGLWLYVLTFIHSITEGLYITNIYLFKTITKSLPLSRQFTKKTINDLLGFPVYKKMLSSKD